MTGGVGVVCATGVCFGVAVGGRGLGVGVRVGVGVIAGLQTAFKNPLNFQPYGHWSQFLFCQFKIQSAPAAGLTTVGVGVGLDVGLGVGVRIKGGVGVLMGVGVTGQSKSPVFSL